MTGVSEARGGAVRPLTKGTLVAASAEYETASAMTVVSNAADFCDRGGALAFAFPGSSPERRKAWPERAVG